MNTVGPGIWRETVKNVKYKIYTCRNWNMVRKLIKEENEKLKWQDMKYGKKTENHEK